MRLHTECRQAAGIALPNDESKWPFEGESACERTRRMVLKPAECPGASVRRFLSPRHVGSISRLFLSQLSRPDNKKPFLPPPPQTRLLIKPLLTHPPLRPSPS